MEEKGLADDFNPASLARATVTQDDESGIGQMAGKAQLPTLEMHGSNLGSQWLVYGGVSGGVPDPEGGKAPPRGADKVPCDWFEFLYHGFIKVGGQYVFGYWTFEVRGKWLEKVKTDVAQHRRPVLRVGRHAKNETVVESITIAAARVAKQQSMGPGEGDGEEEE